MFLGYEGIGSDYTIFQNVDEVGLVMLELSSVFATLLSYSTVRNLTSTLMLVCQI
jgi:hypothetical protein